MFKSGDIVYHDELYFKDKVLDHKRNRPCVVLYEIEMDGINYVCTCPLTSQIKTFNRNPKNYVLIPTVVYNYKKISFANISNAGLRKSEDTHKTSIPLDEVTVSIIKEKIIKSKIKSLQEIKNQLLEIKDKENKAKRDEKALIKKMRNEKRRNAKRTK